MQVLCKANNDTKYEWQIYEFEKLKWNLYDDMDAFPTWNILCIQKFCYYYGNSFKYYSSSLFLHTYSVLSSLSIPPFETTPLSSQLRCKSIWIAISFQLKTTNGFRIRLWVLVDLFLFTVWVCMCVCVIFEFPTILRQANEFYGWDES